MTPGQETPEDSHFKCLIEPTGKLMSFCILRKLWPEQSTVCCRSREAHLVVESSGSSSRKGPFNLVVFAAFAAFPSVPRIWNHGFEGQVLHSSELKDGIMDEILRKKSKVLVVGAGKSGCDMVCAFQKRGYQNLTWLYRSPYWFMNYEAIIFKLTPLNMLRGAMVCNLLTLFLVSGKVALFILWLIGAFTQPKSDSSFPSHFDASKFHFGLLDRKQVDYIRQVPGKVGEPKTLGKEGMVLESEEVIPCDVVIFATGYDTGMQRLRLLKDGKVVEDVCDQPLFHHTVTPCLAALKSLAWVSERLEDASRLRNFPCLLIATTAYYTFGPARGLSLAQYITYYLEAEPSEEVMMKSAARNWSKQFAAKSGVFTSDRCFVQQWLLFYLDLWKNGLMSFYSFLKMVVCLFVFMIYMPLELKVGRKLRYEAASY